MHVSGYSQHSISSSQQLLGDADLRNHPLPLRLHTEISLLSKQQHNTRLLVGNTKDNPGDQ